MTEHTPETHRMRDAVANSDWMDAGRVTPETIREGYAAFDRWLEAEKRKAVTERTVALSTLLDAALHAIDSARNAIRNDGQRSRLERIFATENILNQFNSEQEVTK